MLLVGTGVATTVVVGFVGAAFEPEGVGVAAVTGTALALTDPVTSTAPVPVVEAFTAMLPPRAPPSALTLPPD